SGGHDFGHDLARPQARGVDVGDGVLSDVLLLIARVEDRRAVARADVVALAITRRRIVDLEEELEQVTEADTRRIEDDLDRFGVRAVVLVGGVGAAAAGVADARRDHAVLAADEILHAPETTAGQY